MVFSTHPDGSRLKKKKFLKFKLIAAGKKRWRSGLSPQPSAGRSEKKCRGASYRTRPTDRQGRIVLLISPRQAHGLAPLVPRSRGVQMRAGQSFPISSCLCAFAFVPLSF